MVQVPVWYLPPRVPGVRLQGVAATGPLTADSGVINSTGTTSYRNAETLASVLHRNPVSVQVNRSRKSGGGGGATPVEAGGLVIQTLW